VVLLNYAGKFDAKLSADGSGLHSSVHVETVSPHAAHAPSDAIVVPDAHLLFNGNFKRSGVDLILSKDDQELVLHDYFKGEKRAALSSSDGAHLTGDIVNALAGHVEYAQADGSAAAGHVIGHVTKLVGTATAVRNGVSIILNNGDNVEKGDVVQSGSDSTLGITFIDGTVFGLSSNARMVLNEMVYDPNGSNNSSLLSLVAGTISFVAGETAKHGDMKIDTPVATMGIRGTAVLVEIDFDVPGQNGVPDAKFQVLVEPDGTTGSYILFDKTTLTPLAVVDKAGQQINISNGILSQTTNPLSPEIQKLIIDVFSLKFSDNSNPNSNVHFTDSLTPQALAPIKLASGVTATPIVQIVDTPANSGPSTTNNATSTARINQAPSADVFGAFAVTELPGVTNSNSSDTVSGTIAWGDLNKGDVPTATATFTSFTYTNAKGTFTSDTLRRRRLPPTSRRWKPCFGSTKPPAIPTSAQRPGPTRLPITRSTSLPLARR
jgi:fibronectin-binding autotransporter adhesin